MIVSNSQFGAPACRVVASTLAILAIAFVGGCNDRVSAPLAIDSTGAIQATIATVGVDLPSGYTVVLDSGLARSVRAIDSVLIGGLRQGRHTLALVGTGEDCTLAENTPLTLFVGINQTTFTSFHVTCWGKGLGGSQLAFVRGADIYVSKLNGSGLVQLTTDHRNGDPAWSPDGRRIAFWSWRAASKNLGYGDIYVMNSDGSNAVRRTTTGTNSSPVWSPDGRTIAYASWRATSPAGDIFVVSADDDGTGPVRLTTGCYPAWSPNGRKIAFTGTACDDAIFDDIYTMNADGSNIAMLTDAAKAKVFYWSPDWSPDGRRIAFNVCFNGCSVETMNADGSGREAIAVGQNPRWSPTGRIIAYTFLSAGVPANVYGVAVDGSFRGVISANALSPSWRP